jgi:hypothetical protein
VNGDAPWYAGRGVIASGVFLVLLLVMGGVLVLTRGDDGSRATGPARQQSGTIATGGSVCGMPIGNADPVVGPPRATWKLVGTIAAPSAEKVGPGLLEGHDRRCFAHSPIGATFAAANLLAMFSLPRGSLSSTATLRHFVPNRAREVNAKQPAAPVDPTGRLQLAGFKTTAVDRDNVTVTLAVRVNTSQFGAIVAWEAPMQWMAPGDWRLRLLSVEEPFSGGAIPDLDGFIPWSGA